MSKVTVHLDFQEWTSKLLAGLSCTLYSISIIILLVLTVVFRGLINGQGPSNMTVCEHGTKVRSLAKNQTPIHGNSKNPRHAIDY